MEYNRVSWLAHKKCSGQLDHMFAESFPIVQQLSAAHQKLENRGLVCPHSY